MNIDMSNISIEDAIQFKCPINYGWETDSLQEVERRFYFGVGTTYKGLLLKTIQARQVARLHKTIYRVNEVHEPYEDKKYWDGNEWTVFKIHFERHEWHRGHEAKINAGDYQNDNSQKR